jgi:GGDEF domain-containing protein/ActR/RegA family two-component response regulator
VNVLVVSDGQPAVEWLALAIAIRGHTPLRAADGQTALTQLAQQDCQLVIIDQIESGDAVRLDLCRQIRALPDMRTTPIWVTADPDEPTGIVAAIDAGATGYLTLPYDARQLRTRFEHLERALVPDAALPATTPTDIERLLEAMPDVVAIADTTGQLLLITSSVRLLLGFSNTELTGLNIEALCHPDDVPFLLGQLRATATYPAMQAPATIRLQRANRGWQTVDLYSRDLRSLPAIGGLLLVLRAGSAPESRPQTVERATLTDPQTGLAGSALFNEHLTHALARGERLNRPVAVILVDIAVDDDVDPTRIADLIQRSIRTADIAARLDGSTFAILVEDLEHDEAEHTLAQRMRDKVSTVGVASVAVARSKPGLTSASDLLRDAGHAPGQTSPPPAGPSPPAVSMTVPAVADPEPPQSSAASSEQPPASVQRVPDRPVERSRPDPNLPQSRAEPLEEHLAVIDRFRALEDHLAQLLNTDPR